MTAALNPTAAAVEGHTAERQAEQKDRLTIAVEALIQKLDDDERSGPRR